MDDEPNGDDVVTLQRLPEPPLVRVDYYSTAREFAVLGRQSATSSAWDRSWSDGVG
jgi:hypothetical protein